MLWCYLLWYLLTAALYFDPAPTLWLNSMGLSIIIGVALNLSVAAEAGKWPQPWQIFRFFLIPFCVSSYASLIKNQGFILIFPPDQQQRVFLICCCLGFVGVIKTGQWLLASRAAKTHP